MRGNYDAASQKSSAELPTLFEIYGDLRTLCDYSHVYIRHPETGSVDNANSIDDKITHIISNVLPPQHITGGYFWAGYDVEKMCVEMDALMKQYEAFEDITNALERLKTVVGNEAWKEHIQKLYTPEKIDERHEKMMRYLFDNQRNKIVITKDQYIKGDAKNIKATLQRPREDFAVFDIKNP